MHTVRCRLSEALWHALQARHRATGESIEHIVRAALADHLQVDHSTRDSENAFYAIRVDGDFERLHTRAMCRTEEGVPLAEAAAHQPEFELRHVSGTMIGFWSPVYAKTLSIPGYHLHVLTSDRSAGGHVLDCAGKNLHIQVQRELDLRVSLPHSAEFLRADLTRDPSADLDRAKH